MGWSISTPPGIEPATIDGSGHATFNKNTGNSVVYYTVTYTDSEGTKCVAKVKQKGNPCTYVYTKNTKNIPVEGDENYVFGTLSNVQGQIIEISVTDGKDYLNPRGKITVNGDNQLVGNVYKNTGGTRNIKYKILVKDGDEYKDCGAGKHTNTQDPNNCSCNLLTASTASLSWAWDNTDAKDVTIKYPACITNIRITSTLSYFTASISTVEAGEDKVTIKPNGENRTEAAFTDTLEITYDAGTIEGCKNSIQLRQNVDTCDCPNLEVSPTSLSWAWNGVNVEKTVNLNYTCSDKNSITLSTLSHFTASLNDAKNIITIKPNGENRTETPFTDTLTISYKSGYHNCSSAVTLTQNINGCNCGNLKLSPTSLSWEWDNTDAKPVKITADPCVSLDSITTASTSTDFTVTRNGTTINISPRNSATEERNATITVYYTAGNHSDCYSAISVHQDAKGCICTCDQVEKIYNEENEPSYFYALAEDLTTNPPQPLTNVPFAILTASTSFPCDSSAIRPEIVDGGITEIHCAEYNESFWTGGWKTSFFQKFRNYCATLSRSAKVFIIYGSLSEVTGDKQKRPSGFRYYVCDSVCEDGTVFRVFQRCACGMDNCKNDYTIEEAGEHHILTEDRPLYLDSCSGEWSDGDSICVEKLSVTGARLFKVINGVKQKLIDNTFTPDGTKYILRDKDINWDYTNVICWTSTTQQYCDMTAYCQGKQLNPQYIQWPPSKTSYLNTSRMLTLINDSTYNAVLRIMLSPNGIDSGRGMVQYDIEVERHDYEQLLEIDYHTGDGLKMTAGPTVGWCALLDFTVSIYIAPTGYGYTKEDISGENYKRKLVKCCRCNETVANSIVPRTDIPAAGSNEYIPICTINFNEGCRAHEMIALAKSSGRDIIKVEDNELKFDYAFSLKDKQLIVTALVNPNTSGSVIEENLVLEVYFNDSTPCIRQNITIKQLG